MPDKPRLRPDLAPVALAKTAAHAVEGGELDHGAVLAGGSRACDAASRRAMLAGAKRNMGFRKLGFE